LKRCKKAFDLFYLVTSGGQILFDGSVHFFRPLHLDPVRTIFDVDFFKVLKKQKTKDFKIEIQ